MSRINTNVSSLIAQTALGRSNSQLQVALNRLSTGLRINSGKDDPAGLIASENLRRDITAADKAISNSERASQFIATADSALSQISNLLNDIRGLVTEAANTGVLSDEQVAANQLQVDSSLEAIDRISQVTTFQGRKMLDGSLDFQTTYAAGGATVLDLSITQANLGVTGSVDVSVDITAAATQASITNDGFSPSAATQATGTVTLTAGSLTVSAAAGNAADGVAGNATDIVFQAAADIAQSAGTLTLSTGTIDLTAAAGGTAFDNLTIVIADATGATTASYDSGTNTLTIDVDDGGSGDTTQDIADAIDAEGTFTTSGVTGAAVAYDPLDNATLLNQTTGGDDGTTGAVYAGTTITVDVALGATVSQVATAINALTDFNASALTGGVLAFDTADFAASPFLNPLSGGTDAGTSDVLDADLVVKIAGTTGSEVFTFQAGATLNQVVDAVNLVSDSIGVEATAGVGAVEFRSTAYGSNAFVDFEIIDEGAGGDFEAGLSAIRDTGTDIVANVNGFGANGSGNTLSINTAVLDFSLTVADGSSTDVDFTIGGGGALLQLGPNVVGNQQARVGIGSVNTAKLGGVDGRMYQLRSGGTAALDTDPTTAYRITDAAITKVTSIRGRFGAFQRTTIETNIASLKDTITNLTEAESSIRDADFAKESAALTRAQILVQSGTTVLQIANQSPQQVLALLRG